MSSQELARLGKAGQLRPSDLVWKEGMTGWKPARDVKGLFPTEAPPLPPAVEPFDFEGPPPEAVAEPEYAENSGRGTR